MAGRVRGVAGGAGFPVAVSALSTWFPTRASLDRFRRRQLGRGPAILPPCDGAWRSVAPGFAEWPRIGRSGLPFQIVAERRYDRSGDPRRLGRALAAGKTVFFPQIHQVLPRVARLMAALRAGLLGPLREECSFLFLADGRGREGMGLHHDGEVDALWLQLEGRRTITLGPPVPRATPEDLPSSYARRHRADTWSTFDLAPGTLFYLPPRTPHRVVYFERSAALSLTWGRPARRAGAARRARALADWDVVSGRADPIPRPSRARLWTQVPAAPGAIDRRRGDFPLWLPDGHALRLPAALRPLAAQLAAMPCWQFPRPGPARDRLAMLTRAGILGPCDLPIRIAPEDPKTLDGWRFG